MYLYGSLLIYRPLTDGWLSWPCWLTDSGRLNRKVVTHPASSLVQDRGKFAGRDQRSDHYATAVLQSLPVSCHFRGCKAPLFRYAVIQDCKWRYIKWASFTLYLFYLYKVCSRQFLACLVYTQRKPHYRLIHRIKLFRNVVCSLWNSLIRCCWWIKMFNTTTCKLTAPWRL